MADTTAIDRSVLLTGRLFMLYCKGYHGPIIPAYLESDPLSLAFCQYGSIVAFMVGIEVGKSDLIACD